MTLSSKAVREEIFEEVSLLMDDIIQDNTIPKNIRDCVQAARLFIKDGELDVEASKDRALQKLNITEDPNMDMYTRSQIWNIISLLES